MIFETEKEAIEWLEKNKIDFISKKEGFIFTPKKVLYLRTEFAQSVESHLGETDKSNPVFEQTASTFLEAVNLLAERLVPDKLKPQD